MTTNHSAADPSITEIVKEKYAQAAKSGLSSEHSGVRQVAAAFGYSVDELASIPAEANLGLSCGNPIATASLKPGEVVVDLGCGGGIDVLLAAQRVGPTGKAIGIDMTEAMLELARANSLRMQQTSGPLNVEFHLASIDKLPLPDQSVDCVISNCVINLAPDKDAVFREIARVLKPGGRVAVSDIALKQAIPDELGQSLAAYVGCIAGAISLQAYDQGLRAAGFAEVQIIDAHADLNAYASVENQAGCCSPAMMLDDKPLTTSGGPLSVLSSGCCGSGSVANACCDEPSESSTVHQGLAELLSRYNVNDYAASVKVFAIKPQPVASSSAERDSSHD